jgi:hypothetical protein
MNDEPLIYTIMGNIPIASLEYSSTWVDADTYIKFIETYKLGDEIVKQSAHVMVKRGLLAEATPGKFPGA